MRGLKILNNPSGSSSVAALISHGSIRSGGAFAIDSPPFMKPKAGPCWTRFRAGFWWRACRLIRASICLAFTVARGFA
jgi:hypothetical protein